MDDFQSLGSQKLGKGKIITAYKAKMETYFGLSEVAEDDNVREAEEDDLLDSDFEY